MPYEKYLHLVDLVKNNHLFQRRTTGKKNAVGKPSNPIELLILKSLRYLGRGWTFDDLKENTGISQEVIRVFLHKFIEFGGSTLYERFVKSPSTIEEAEQQSHEFAMARLPGAIASMDASHVLHERVSCKLRQAHLGFKLNATARTYNLVVNHRHRILSTKDGHPARWNRTTLVRFDKVTMGLRDDFVAE